MLNLSTQICSMVNYVKARTSVFRALVYRRQTQVVSTPEQRRVFGAQAATDRDCLEVDNSADFRGLRQSDGIRSTEFGAGFTEWLKKQQAQRDSFGYAVCLVR